MELKLNYSEIELLIKNKSKQQVKVGFVDRDTVRIGYKVKVMMFEKEFAVDLKVVQIDGCVVKMEFADKTIMQLALGAILKVLPFDFIKAEDGYILVDTEEINECKELYKHATLKGLSFSSSTANIELELNI